MLLQILFNYILLASDKTLIWRSQKDFGKIQDAPSLSVDPKCK